MYNLNKYQDNIYKMDLNDFCGNKIIYISEDMVIDEKYNVFSIGIRDEINRITGEEEGRFVQAEYCDSYNSYLFLTENGQVICKDSVYENDQLIYKDIEISEDSKNILKNKKIIKITSNGYLLDEEGKIYFTDYIDNNKIGIVEDSVTLGIDNVRIKDVDGLSLLDAEGKVYNIIYNYNEETNEEEFTINCLSDDNTSPIYGKKIVQISDARNYDKLDAENYQSYIDTEGNRYSFGKLAKPR